MGRYDQIIDWFKQRHDTLLDDLEPLESGLRRMMEFDGYDWRDVTPQLIAEGPADREPTQIFPGFVIGGVKGRPRTANLRRRRAKESFLMHMSWQQVSRVLTCEHQPSHVVDL